MEQNEVQRALELGAQRSREASSLPEQVPVPVKLWTRVWMKHRWLIIGALLFLLIDLIVLGGIGSTGSGGW